MSIFGKGLTYCIGLFLAHEEGLEVYEKTLVGITNPYVFWFNKAADHLIEMQIPTFLPKKLQTDLRELREKSIGWRMGDAATIKDFLWAIERAKNCLLRIDKYFKIKSKEATCK